jgi:DegV family protein with EDD domain
MFGEAAVVTGSVAQVPKDVAENLGIEVLPLIISVNGEEFRDQVTIDAGQLYKRMRVEQLEVKTAAPTVGEYYEAFKRIREKDIHQIICNPVSTNLSSDYSAAVNAANIFMADYPDVKICVLDSRRVAVTQGLLCIEAAQKLKDGVPFEEVVEYCNIEWRKTGLFAAVETLKYLAQGGRIGKAASLLGNSLHIMPILSVVNDEGITAPAAVLRRKDKIVPTLVSLVKKYTDGYSKLRLGVTHADNLEGAEALREALLAEFPGREILIDDFTPVMGAHTGPGLLAVGYLYE